MNYIVLFLAIGKALSRFLKKVRQTFPRVWGIPEHRLVSGGEKSD